MNSYQNLGCTSTARRCRCHHQGVTWRQARPLPVASIEADALSTAAIASFPRERLVGEFWPSSDEVRVDGGADVARWRESMAKEAPSIEHGGHSPVLRRISPGCAYEGIRATVRPHLTCSVTTHSRVPRPRHHKQLPIARRALLKPASLANAVPQTASLAWPVMP